MKFSLFFCVVLSVVLSILFVEVKSQTVYCETIGTEDLTSGWGYLKVCFMETTNTIDSDGFVISPAGSSVEAISFFNRKIHFLPIRTDETFPNIVDYGATRCSIKTVSKENFRNLKKLKFLHLSWNQIERIHDDTFADLMSLEVLDLHANKLKQINGAAFSGLSKLKRVHLNENFCINSDYETLTEIATLTREVTEKCGFTEGDETTENIANVVQSLNVSLEELMKENRTLTDILALMSQLKISEDSKSAEQIEITAINATLKAAQDAT